MAKHPNKAIQGALEHAEAHGWTVRKAGKSGHAWGKMLCPSNLQCRGGIYCLKSIWSTPASPENHARELRKIVDGCPEDSSDEELDDG